MPKCTVQLIFFLIFQKRVDEPRHYIFIKNQRGALQILSSIGVMGFLKKIACHHFKLHWIALDCYLKACSVKDMSIYHKAHY